MKNAPHRSTEAQAFARRLRQVIKQAGLKVSATELAHAFNLRDWDSGITPHAARNWLNGVSIPKQGRLRVLCEILQITPHDLLFGPYPAHDRSASETADGAALADRCMWHKYHSLSLDHQRMVRELTNGLHRLESHRPGEQADSDPKPEGD